MSCSTCKKDCGKNITLCPLCDKSTYKVLTDEVYGIIKEDVRKYVHASQFHLCDNEDCEVVFHSTDCEEIILTQDIQKDGLKEDHKKALTKN